MAQCWTPPKSSPAKLSRSLRSDLFPGALGAVGQAGAHGFDLVNLAAPDLEDFTSLQIGRVAVHRDGIDAGHAFDLDRMYSAAMLEHGECVDQSSSTNPRRRGHRRVMKLIIWLLICAVQVKVPSIAMA